MKIYDICTFNGESELFEIRYQVLKDFVDEFRVIEFDQTFSGKPKQPLFAQNWPKVKSYYVTQDIWSKYEGLARSSPNTQYGKGAEHWVREFCMKESIKDCLNDLQDKDQVFIGDCDEIYENVLYYKRPEKLKLRVYSYYLNNRSNEQFWGTLLAEYKDIKNSCLNHLRALSPKNQIEVGWHFTSMKDGLRKKLEDSYTSDSYANDWVMSNLDKNIENNKDFLGRNFEYKLEESQWPEYLRGNKDKYKHLLKSE